MIDVRDFGAKFDNQTDDTSALQAAIDAAQMEHAYGLPNANDWPAQIVQMPPGRSFIHRALLLPANVWLRGEGSASTYLVHTGENWAIKLRTGGEVQTALTDFGLIVNNAEAEGIELFQTGAPSILGDSAHRVENVVVVGGARALFTYGGTENRIVNVLAYRQTPPAGSASVYLGGTDFMVDRLTVAQPQHVGGSGPGGAGLRCGTSNSRLVNVKVFGGNAPFNGAMESGLMFIGQRNQVIGLEVQDFAGGWAVECHQGNNVFSGVVLDSNQGGGMVIGGVDPTIVRGALIVNRPGGSHVASQALHVLGAADLEAHVVGFANTFTPNSQPAGPLNHYTINGVQL